MRYKWGKSQGNEKEGGPCEEGRDERSGVPDSR